MRESTNQKRKDVFDVRELFDAQGPRGELVRKRKARVPARKVGRNASKLTESTQGHSVMNFRVSGTVPRLTTHDTTRRRASGFEVREQTVKSGDGTAWPANLSPQYFPRPPAQRTDAHRRTVADSFDHSAQSAAATSRNDQRRRFRRGAESCGTRARIGVSADQFNLYVPQFGQFLSEQRRKLRYARFILAGAGRAVDD